MSRNVNSFFSEVPASLDISRSKFIRNQSIKTSFNIGDLIPFYVDEVLPGVPLVPATVASPTGT